MCSSDLAHLGACYTGLSSISLLVSTTLSARVLRRLGAVRTCCIGLAAGTGLVSLGAVSASAAFSSRHQAVFFWMAAALYQVGQPLYNPSIPTMLLQCVPPYRRGAIMGLDSSVNTVARILAPVALGTLYQLHGAAACFYAAGGIVLAAAATAGGRRLLVIRKNAELA